MSIYWVGFRMYVSELQEMRENVYQDKRDKKW